MHEASASLTFPPQCPGSKHGESTGLAGNPLRLPRGSALGGTSYHSLLPHIHSSSRALPHFSLCLPKHSRSAGAQETFSLTCGQRLLDSKLWESPVCSHVLTSLQFLSQALPSTGPLEVPASFCQPSLGANLQAKGRKYPAGMLRQPGLRAETNGHKEAASLAESTTDENALLLQLQEPLPQLHACHTMVPSGFPRQIGSSRNPFLTMAQKRSI